MATPTTKTSSTMGERPNRATPQALASTSFIETGEVNNANSTLPTTRRKTILLHFVGSISLFDMMEMLLTGAVDTVFPCICDFFTFAEALQFRTVNRRARDLVEEFFSEDRCAAFLEKRLQQENLYAFGDTREWRASTQSDVNILKKVIHGSTTAGPNQERIPLRALLDVILVMKYIPMEAAIGYSDRYGRILIPYEEQVRCITEESTEEEPSGGHIYEPCHCSSENSQGQQQQQQPIPCRGGCKLIGNIPTRRDRVTTQGNTADDGYSVDDFYTCTRPSPTNENVMEPLELKTYFPVCVPNLPPTLKCPVCRTTSHRTLFLSEVSYQSSESSPDFRSIEQTFTPIKVDDSQQSQAAKRVCREETWRDRLFPHESSATSSSSFCYPPAPYRDVGVHTNVPIEHTPDQKSCISIHCEECKQFGLLAPVVPCHDIGFPCETVRTHPQEDSLRDVAYEAALGAVLVRTRCNCHMAASVSNPDGTDNRSPCFKAPLCMKCSSEDWHHVWEARPLEGRPNHAHLNSRGLNFIVSCSSCRLCNLRLCHEHSWLTSVCHQ